jgi:hypothetical protein
MVSVNALLGNSLFLSLCRRPPPVSPHPPLGLGIGIAAFPADGNFASTRFEIAGQRLYHNKKQS